MNLVRDRHFDDYVKLSCYFYFYEQCHTNKAGAERERKSEEIMWNKVTIKGFGFFNSPFLSVFTPSFFRLCLVHH